MSQKRTEENYPRIIITGTVYASLTHFSLETPKVYLTNNDNPDQMPQNAASDQGLHCLQIF